MKTPQPAALSATVTTGQGTQQVPLDFADGDILLVDATRQKARALARKLALGTRIRIAIASHDPLVEALARPPRVVILGLGEGGLAPPFLQELRTHTPLRHLPVLALADNHESALTASLRQCDVQALASRTAPAAELMAQLAALRLAAATCSVSARLRDQCYETLLHAMDDGFCIIKMVFDDAGRPQDYRFLLVNAAFERNTGLQAAQGRLMRDLAPAHEDHWFELYGHIAKTGEPLHFERPAEQLNRWYEVSAFRYGEPGNDEVAIFFKDISARKRAEEESRQTAGMLQMALRLGRVGAWSLDVAEHRMEWTPQARAIHELPDDVEASPDLAATLLDDSSRPYVEAAVEQCAGTGAPFDLEARARTFHGRPLWIRLIGEAVRDANGVIRRVQGVIQDITDLTTASKHARDLSDQLGETVEGMTDAFFTLSNDWRFMYVNGRAERLLRRPRSELLGKSIWEALPHLVDTPMQHALQQAQTHFAPIETELYSDRLATWFALRFCPSERGLAVYFRDISDDKNRERALAESEEHYRLLFETSLDGILQTREDGSIVRANEAACRLFGMTESQFRRAHKSSLVAPEDQRFHALMLQRLRSGATRSELRMVRADGSRFDAEVAAAQFRASNGELGNYVVVRDITERIRGQNEAAQLTAQLASRVHERTIELENANRELKEFAQSLAHDVRGPIAAINAFASALSRDLATGAPKKAPYYVDRILQAALRVNEYTEALLSLVRLSHVELKQEPVDLSAMADEILGSLRTSEPEREVVTTVQDDLRATGDPTLLRMLLQNLLGNAWKFTGGKPRASISFAAERQANGALVYRVRDDGAGFDMAQQRRLFCSFQRLHAENEFPGTGIGLANVHRIVARHGGRVWAQGAVGKGATFFFTLEGAATRPSGD